MPKPRMLFTKECIFSTSKIWLVGQLYHLILYDVKIISESVPFMRLTRDIRLVVMWSDQFFYFIFDLE